MKAYSQANRGKPFEDFLKFVHQRYQQSGTACVHKVPTEFIPIRNARGEVCNCKVEGASCVDYLGRYHSTPEAVGIVIVSFSLRRFFAVPWEFWKAARDAWNNKPNPKSTKAPVETVKAYGWEWQTPGMASVSPEQLLPEWEIRAGGTTGLPYLNIIDRMKGGHTE